LYCLHGIGARRKRTDAVVTVGLGHNDQVGQCDRAFWIAWLAGAADVS
jgi:hypothetical protein